MLAVNQKPDWKNHAPPNDYSSLVPQERFGLPVTWTEGVNPIPVFLAQFGIKNGADTYLLGFRFDTEKMLLKGRPGGDGFFLQFAVVEYGHRDELTMHVLKQHRSPIYSQTDEGKDWIWFSDLKPIDVANLSSTPSSLPVWQEDEAQWPLVHGRPMRFIGQFFLPLNDVTKTHLTWDKSIYLFWAEEKSSSVFKIFAQDCDSQPVESHYREEERSG